MYNITWYYGPLSVFSSCAMCNNRGALNSVFRVIIIYTIYDTRIYFMVRQSIRVLAKSGGGRRLGHLHGVLVKSVCLLCRE